MKSIPSLRGVPAALTLITAIFSGQNFTRAAESTWSGAGADANWSTVENWSALPVDGDALIFSGASRLVNNNDLTLNSNAWVRFDSPDFVLNGNPLTLINGITNSIGTNSISLNLAWTNVARFFSVAPDSELVIAGTNTISFNDHTYLGGGRFRLKGFYVQSNNPPATILNSIDYINDGGTFINAGGVRITSGTTPTASKLILTNGAVMNQIDSRGAIRVGDIADLSGELIIDNSTLMHSGGNIFIPFAASGIGAVIQNGGAISNADIAFCNGDSGVGTYDMVGGTLEATRIRKIKATGTASISFDGSTLRAAATPNSTFFTGLNSAEIKSGGLILHSAGANFTVGQSFTGVGRLTKTGSGNVTFTGSSTCDGLTLNQGTAILNSANTFSGVIVSGGTLQIGNDAAIATNLELNGGTIRGNNATPRTINVPVKIGGNVTFANTSDLTFNGAFTLAGSRTLTVNNTNTFNGAISQTGGSASLTKAGSGTLILNAPADHSGDTTISAGTLVLGASGSLANSANFSVASGATFDVSALSGGLNVGAGKALKGAGTVVGAVNISGTIAPGSAVGTLTGSAVTLNAGATYQWEVNNSGADSVNATSLDLQAVALTLDITALESLTGWNASAATNWVLVHTTGGISNFDANKVTIVDHFSALNAVGSGSFSVTSDGTDLLLQFTPGAGDAQARVLTAATAGSASFTGLPNTSYTVQYTESLSPASWQTLTTVGAGGVVTTDSNGAGNFQDPAAPAGSQRYYRILNP